MPATATLRRAPCPNIGISTQQLPLRRARRGSRATRGRAGSRCGALLARGEARRPLGRRARRRRFPILPRCCGIQRSLLVRIQCTHGRRCGPQRVTMRKCLAVVLGIRDRDAGPDRVAGAKEGPKVGLKGDPREATTTSRNDGVCSHASEGRRVVADTTSRFRRHQPRGRFASRPCTSSTPMVCRSMRISQSRFRSS